jgi:hypothetical protein
MTKKILSNRSYNLAKFNIATQKNSVLRDRSSIVEITSICKGAQILSGESVMSWQLSNFVSFLVFENVICRNGQKSKKIAF